MKKKLLPVLPFIIMPVFIPIYNILDSLIFVDVFGCGCVPGAQTNMLNIAFNANDLRRLVFFLLRSVLTVWSILLARSFPKRYPGILYCIAAIVFNMVLGIWAVNAFMWA